MPLERKVISRGNCGLSESESDRTILYKGVSAVSGEPRGAYAVQKRLEHSRRCDKELWRADEPILGGRISAEGAWFAIAGDGHGVDAQLLLDLEPIRNLHN